MFNRLKKHISELPYYYKKVFRPTFILNGQKYYYFYHRHNIAWKNERTVEIPIIWKVVKNNSHKRILEVGNVLSHYFSIKHDVLDKYEKQKGVINQDAVSFNPRQKYDLIVSISTLEHIGFDEKVKDPLKIIEAINNLKENCLNKRGIIIFTLPLGYNLQLDNLLKQKKIQLDKVYYLKRISNFLNQWQETSWTEVKNSHYHCPFPYANGLIIGVFKN